MPFVVYSLLFLINNNAYFLCLRINGGFHLSRVMHNWPGLPISWFDETTINLNDAQETPRTNFQAEEVFQNIFFSSTLLFIRDK